MAHLWYTDSTGAWGIHPLADSPCVVRFSPDGPVFDPSPAEPQATGVVLMQPVSGAASDAWVIVAGRATDVRVNGADLVLGLRAMRNRDDVSVAGQRLYFSTER